MDRSARQRGTTRRGTVLVAALALMLGGLTACTADDGAGGTGTTLPAGDPGVAAPAPGGPCPTAPIAVVTTTAQWAQAARELTGSCATVTPIAGPAAATPGYEPTPEESAALARADLLVMNGSATEEWLARALTKMSRQPAVVSASAVTERPIDDVPHTWFAVADIEKVAAAVTTAARPLLPGADGFLDGRARGWADTAKPFTDLAGEVRGRHAGRRFASTDPGFEEFAITLELQSRNPGAPPAGPAGQDVGSTDGLVEAALQNREVDLLVVPAGAAEPHPLRVAAERAGVPIAELELTPPPAGASVVEWQVRQLRTIDAALGGTR